MKAALQQADRRQTDEACMAWGEQTSRTAAILAGLDQATFRSVLEAYDFDHGVSEDGPTPQEVVNEALNRGVSFSELTNDYCVPMCLIIPEEDCIPDTVH
jgi:hypothetical protein